MKAWKQVLVGPATTIERAVEIIDKDPAQVALVVDGENHLLGTVTDGDVRRAMLNGISAANSVSLIMNPSPTVATPMEGRNALIATMRERKILQIPILDGHKTILGLETLRELAEPIKRENPVVLMAGGLGSRLRPLTDELPKPMLQVGNRPILETVLLSFIEHGFTRFYFAVNYKAEVIRKYFGNGSAWSVEITYLQETEPLGTAGALGLLPEMPTQPLVVMNADLLTKLNLHFLLDFHESHEAAATMCVREYYFDVPYGVLKLDHHRILDIEEKPRQRFFVNAGIYALDPKILACLDRGKYLDMPALFQQLIAKGLVTKAFPIREFWLDIGQRADFDKAVGEFEMQFR